MTFHDLPGSISSFSPAILAVFTLGARAVETQEFIVQGSLNNALCFLGPHRKYHAFNPNSQELVPGQGHFGPDALPGDARWRRGESVSQEGARNQSEVFFNSLAFQLCHIPPELRWWSSAGFVPAYKYAAFEAVKNDPKYGGQLIREEIDLFTMQSLYSVLGLAVAVGFLALRIAELGLRKFGLL